VVTHELDIAHYWQTQLIVRDGKVVNEHPVANRSCAEVRCGKKFIEAEAAAKAHWQRLTHAHRLHR